MFLGRHKSSSSLGCLTFFWKVVAQGHILLLGSDYMPHLHSHTSTSFFSFLHHIHFVIMLFLTNLKWKCPNCLRAHGVYKVEVCGVMLFNQDLMFPNAKYDLPQWILKDVKVQFTLGEDASMWKTTQMWCTLRPWTYFPWMSWTMLKQVGVFFSLSSPYIYASMINKMGIGTLQAFAWVFGLQCFVMFWFTLGPSSSITFIVVVIKELVCFATIEVACVF